MNLLRWYIRFLILMNVPVSKGCGYIFFNLGAINDPLVNYYSRTLVNVGLVRMFLICFIRDFLGST